jgi:hypothetical protein
MTRGHDGVRQHRSGWSRRRSLQRGQTAVDPIHAKFVENVELTPSGRLRAPIGQIDDEALLHAIDCRVRLIDEVLQALGKPIIASCPTAIAVHALLYHDPIPGISNDEAVQVKIEAILYRGTVNFGDQATRSGHCLAVEPHAMANRHQLVRRLPRILAPPAADMDAEFHGQRCQAALQRSDDGGGDA